MSDNSNLPIDVTPTSDAPGADGSGVHSRPTSAASGDADHRVAVIAPPNPVRDMVSGLADTQELKQRVDPPRRMVTNRKLGRTLRMELGISPVKLPPSAADN
ncbi:MAG TPA: hypothetical protein VGI70_16455, partial [Polyangiales bacterium]